MDKVMPLFHCDLFIKEDVGTDEEREDLKKQILQAKEDNRGTQGGGNPGCWRSTATYNMDWLYESMRVLSNEANKQFLLLKHLVSCCRMLSNVFLYFVYPYNYASFLVTSS